MQNLKLQLLEPIKKENIFVYPDKGEFEDWNKKVIELQKQGFKIKCSSIIENTEFETGTDLADVYFAKRNNVSENKIEIVENKPLARNLYDTVEVGQAIPPELFLKPRRHRPV